MILLFMLLLFTGFKVTWIEAGAAFFVNNLPLFFIPATAGIIDYFYLFTGKGILLIFIVLLSTALVMAVSGLVSQKLALGKGRVRGE